MTEVTKLAHMYAFGVKIEKNRWDPTLILDEETLSAQTRLGRMGQSHDLRATKNSTKAVR